MFSYSHCMVIKIFYEFDDFKGTVVLNLSSALHKTTFDIQKVYIFMKKCYKFSPPCTFDSTCFVQLVELRGMQKL